MKVCPNCFADQELKGFIGSSKDIGTCKVCKSVRVPLLEIQELYDFFQELLDNFKPSSGSESLKAKIQGNWSFFASHKTASAILNHVLQNINTEITSCDESVDYINDIIDNYTHWEKLKEELKWSRRYLSDIKHLTEDLRWDSFFETQYELSDDVKLYRARVHHQSGQPAYEPKNMFCPKADMASGGRANSQGIPYLYLSDNPETVLYEVRASYLDELSVGTFQVIDLIAPIKIVDFTEDTPLFQPDYVNQTIKAHLLRKMISRELSKPMRRYDSEIEYIPTQFICEFIRVFTGAYGIKFKSSLHPDGNNIVIFDQGYMECTRVDLKKVKKLSLTAIDI